MVAEKILYWFGVGVLTLVVFNNVAHRSVEWAKSYVERPNPKLDVLSQQLPVETLARLQAALGTAQSLQGRQSICLRNQLSQMQITLAKRQAVFAEMQAERAQRDAMQSVRHAQCPHQVLSIAYTEADMPATPDAPEETADTN